MKKKIIISLITVLLISGGVYAFWKWQKNQKEGAPPAVEFTEINAENQNSESPQKANESTTQENAATIKENSANSAISKTTNPPPSSLNLKMTFYAQAPFGIWDYPWQEACEEASVLLIANTYFKHNWSAKEFNEEILKLVEWEKEQFGDYKHTNIEETQKILNDYFKLETKIHENPSYEDIQNILAKGHFIVMPLAGKKIGNPFYKNGGPIYHVLVVKGYKEGQKLVTSDVGTKNGENYVYKWKVLEKALHDYAEPIEDGSPRIIEVFPNK